MTATDSRVPASPRLMALRGAGHETDAAATARPPAVVEASTGARVSARGVTAGTGVPPAPVPAPKPRFAPEHPLMQVLANQATNAGLYGDAERVATFPTS